MKKWELNLTRRIQKVRFDLIFEVLDHVTSVELVEGRRVEGILEIREVWCRLTATQDEEQRPLQTRPQL